LVQMPAGYSGKPLVSKLGIKQGQKIAILNAPRNYEKLLTGIPPDVKVARELEGELDFVQLFARDEGSLEQQLKMSIDKIKDDGMIWVSWPKGGPKSLSGLGEGKVRSIGLNSGLVDVKICAVDETWSALKFVKRLKDRR
jgi:Protein of unknown function (DUF3052)